MESTLLLLTDILYEGFALFAPLLFIVKLSWKAKAIFWNELLLSSNLLLLYVSSLFTLYYLVSIAAAFTIIQKHKLTIGGLWDLTGIATGS